ncbi:uncharacterized protein N7483_002874 [Penicillium malachiteum]|uniref:uncharacterized protein n=1 Tax=Penicillium malachiteum TaxID=1324776 RepID=UPI0025484D66|nr:uncharacterized protein N7483_002874 [Penicillium malachiteum]KAJ5737749.1 hypothetical protein N7483_002874 [Penicillium malachiteum]
MEKQPPSRQPSRYRSTRKGTRPATDKVCAPTNRQPEPSSAPPEDSTPQISRSMSRYRRYRREIADDEKMPAKTPSVSSCARAPPAAPLPDKAKVHHTVEEEQMREKHRLDTMAQLTGGSHEVKAHKSSSHVAAQPAQHEYVDDGSRLPMRARRPETNNSDKEHRPSSNPSTNSSGRKSFLQKVKLSKSKGCAEKELSGPRYIGVGGGGIVPGTDAPISAVNAGERMVRVQYSDNCISLPVTPSTLVSDLLLSASEKLSPDIDAEQFIMLESFQQVGLQRPLRRYEHIREVMNSWAHDSDNRLIVIPPSSIDILDQVDAQRVPIEKPVETTVYLYYSQRRRKWDKRYVTLRADGQIVVSKKENSKDCTNICHLSDFDIYSPTARAIAKDVKPPKKICFAIKSLEKSSMFLSTENFVHFFSTNDRATADQWYRSVQQWRSWYLVNTLGAVKPAETEKNIPKRTLTNKSVRRMSMDVPEVPLVDLIPSDPEPLTRVRPSMDQTRSPAPRDGFARKKSTREHAPPPSRHFPETLLLNLHIPAGGHDDNSMIQSLNPEQDEEETFSPTGLLGRTYTQRQHIMRERQENEKRANQEAFIGTGLLAESQPHVPMSTAPSQSPAMPTRSKSVRSVKSVKQTTKPLVDLTPVFQEPPQHIRKGRGVTVEPGVLLIDAATGPELAPSCMSIPPALAWRRPSVPVTDVPPVPQMRHRSNTARSVRHVPTGTNVVGPSPSTPAMPFLPNSLLANARSTNAQSEPVGHGVATGDRNATRPMLDMSPENPFAEGSLLHQL